MPSCKGYGSNPMSCPPICQQGYQECAMPSDPNDCTTMPISNCVPMMGKDSPHISYWFYF